MTVNGNTVLGTSGVATQTLTVYAGSTFYAAVIASTTLTVTGTFTANGNAVLGATSSQALIVNAGSTFNAPVLANSDVNIAPAGILTARGNVVLGSLGNNRSLTVTARATVFNSSETGASVTVANTSTFAANGNVAVGTNRSNTLTVNSDSTFYGAVTGTVGVQVQAVAIMPTAAGPVIPSTVSFVDATANNASTNSLKLPIAVMGLQVQIQAGATQFLVAPYNSTNLINADSTSTSHTLYPQQLVSCVAASSTTWYCTYTGIPVTCVAGVCVQGSFAVGQKF